MTPLTTCPTCQHPAGENRFCERCGTRLRLVVTLDDNSTAPKHAQPASAQLPPADMVPPSATTLPAIAPAGAPPAAPVGVGGTGARTSNSRPTLSWLLVGGAVAALVGTF